MRDHAFIIVDPLFALTWARHVPVQHIRGISIELICLETAHIDTLTYFSHMCLQNYSSHKCDQLCIISIINKQWENPEGVIWTPHFLEKTIRPSTQTLNQILRVELRHFRVKGDVPSLVTSVTRHEVGAIVNRTILSLQRPQELVRDNGESASFPRTRV